MRVVKIMLAINGVTLVMNDVIVWLMIIKSFPAVLGIALVVGFLAGGVWAPRAVMASYRARQPSIGSIQPRPNG